MGPTDMLNNPTLDMQVGMIDNWTPELLWPSTKQSLFTRTVTVHIDQPCIVV